MASWLSAGGGTTMRGGVGILLEYVSFLCGKRRRGGGAAIEPIGGLVYAEWVVGGWKRAGLRLEVVDISLGRMRVKLCSDKVRLMTRVMLVVL